MIIENLGRCVADRGCVVRFRSGNSGVCALHIDEYDPWHRAEVDAKRLALGERFNLTIVEAAVLAARLHDPDDNTASAVA
ncbi:MAG TPA: hypothetical protein VGL75_10960 [Acidothermaceae bacterium]|jgi:hypothetical protein